MKTMINILFGETQKSKHLREKAIELLMALRNKGMLSVKEAMKICEHRKTYYKVTRKLKDIGLISLTKTIDGDFYWNLTIDAYKYWVRKNLIEGVENRLK